MTTKPDRKALLVSPELCIGCRGCQTACKSWNRLPGRKTDNRGTLQNPPDVSDSAFTIIRFSEVPSLNNPVRWLFVSRRCMHCGDPACMKICPAPGALYKTPDGAVAFNKEKCIGCKLCAAACPFDVPRFDAREKIAKCDLCAGRVAEGLPPACAKTCATGALRYGDRAGLLTEAKKAGYKKVYGEADISGLGVLYAFMDEPRLYGMNENPAIPESIIFWHNVLRPLAVIGLGGVVAGALLHYVTVGPHKDEEEVNK